MYLILQGEHSSELCLDMEFPLSFVEALEVLLSLVRAFISSLISTQERLANLDSILADLRL